MLWSVCLFWSVNYRDIVSKYLLWTLKAITIIWSLLPLQTFAQKEELRWKHFGNLHNGYHRFGAIALSPTQVLVTAGFIQNVSWRGEEGVVSRECEIIDIERCCVFMASSMNVGHAHGALIRTIDSNVIILGGLDTSKKVTSVCELYNRKTGQWEIIGNLVTARWMHSAIMINSEEILIVGGRSGQAVISDAEIFNITTRKSHAIAHFPSPSEITTLFISQIAAPGRILATGGRTGGKDSFRNACLYEYDKAKNQWKRAFQGVIAGNGVRLSDNQFALFSTTWASKPQAPIMLVENSLGFHPIKNLSFESRVIGQMISWGNNIGLIIGGSIQVGREPQQQSEWFDLESGSVVEAPKLLQMRVEMQAIVLEVRNLQGAITKKSVLAIGGENGSNVLHNSIEILETSDKALINIPSSLISRLRLQKKLFSHYVIIALHLLIILLIIGLLYITLKILRIRRKLRVKILDSPNVANLESRQQS
ncbi:MAG: hypothetical protein MUF71_10970 [Candidatus Kapabacteria bacterium]|jgi:hypothetical protein|nr:hypothetical protein [Candidatus Kapabacteria bacterium]